MLQELISKFSNNTHTKSTDKNEFLSTIMKLSKIKKPWPFIKASRNMDFKDRSDKRHERSLE